MICYFHYTTLFFPIRCLFALRIELKTIIKDSLFFFVRRSDATQMLNRTFGGTRVFRQLKIMVTKYTWFSLTLSEKSCSLKKIKKPFGVKWELNTHKGTLIYRKFPYLSEREKRRIRKKQQHRRKGLSTDPLDAYCRYAKFSNRENNM